MFLWEGSEEVYKMTPHFAARLGEAMQGVQLHLLDTLYSLRQCERPESTWLHAQLPLAAQRKLTPRLCMNLLSALQILAFKAFTPLPMPLACTAEELLLVWVLEEMEATAEELGNAYDSRERDDLIGAVIGDFDFEFLLDPAYDGADKVEAMGIVSANPDDWFLACSDPPLTCPLTWPPEVAYWHPSWETYRQKKGM